MVERRPTRAETILSAIRDDILNGHLAPGTQLAFADMSKRYAASTGVLREVLPRLVEQGLATSQPQLGFRVIELSIRELQHLTEARAVIESLIFEQSIVSGDLDWEAEVVAVHHRLSQLPTIGEDGELDHDWLSTHRRFHQVLLAGCENARLREVAERLRDASEVYRCWSVRSTDELALRDEEHRRLATLAVKRDVAGASQALRDHIVKTTEVLIDNQRRKTGMTSA
mgnify:CR=1 FL=1